MSVIFDYVLNKLRLKDDSSSSGGGGVQSVTATDASIAISGTATNPKVGLGFKIFTAYLDDQNSPTLVFTIGINTTGLTATFERTGVGQFIIHIVGTPSFTNCEAWISSPIQVDGADIFYTTCGASTNAISISTFDSSITPADNVLSRVNPSVVTLLIYP